MKYKSQRDLLSIRVTTVMMNASLWKDYLKEEIPTSWEKYNNFVIFSDKYFKSKAWYIVGPILWEKIGDLFDVQNIALKGKIQDNGYRSPKANVVWGESKWVEWKDNGVIYFWNIEHSMFCSGNLSERHRIAKLNCEGETVVDMFAGIGYFTLPYLVKALCKHLHACEWNPHAIQALKLNLEKNNVSEKCTIHEGDNQIVCPRDVADRVNMGLIPTCRESWNVACRALKSSSGGVLHLHENVNSKVKDLGDGEDLTDISRAVNCPVCQKLISCLGICAKANLPINLSFEVSTNLNQDFHYLIKNNKCELLWKKYEWLIWAVHTAHLIGDIFIELYKKSWTILVKNIHCVKSYAPHIEHLVLDLECRPDNFK